MKFPLFSFVVLIIAFASCGINKQNHDKRDYSEYVNPFIGTDFIGNTYPGVQMPFGMVQLSPDNGFPGRYRNSGYSYKDSTIVGFSHIHFSGTDVGNLCDISFMPVTLPYKKCEKRPGIYSSFSHEDEKSEAGYYSVLLKNYNIKVELTATERCGLQRYTFSGGKAAVLLNLKKDYIKDTHIEIIDSCTVQGYCISGKRAKDRRIYFRTRFSKPFISVVADSSAIIHDNKRIDTANVIQFNFNVDKNEQIVVTTSISGVSMEGARKNMMAEVPNNDFDDYLSMTRNAWKQELGKIEVEGDNTDDMVNFYTALYHTKLAPAIFSDVDGSYLDPDKKIHNVNVWINYSNFSLWNTYRAEHPLLTYTDPQRVNDMIKSFIAFYEQKGRLPEWNIWDDDTSKVMGYHAVPVIVDAYLKGIGDFNAEKALEACVASANMDSYCGMDIYKKKGYIPYNLNNGYGNDDRSLSKTLEYAYDDYCISVMASKMGKTELAEQFKRRSDNYHNVFNPATGFMQPIDDRGVFMRNFNPENSLSSICGSNAWQYLWSVQHDVYGLISLLGGKDRFAAKLDTMFSLIPSNGKKESMSNIGMIGQYAHGNESCHHVIYLYNKIRQPWKTQKYIAQVMNNFYTNSPAGLCGNDDSGQMSAWYVFSAMGFYPVNPVGGEYEIGTPLFRRMSMHLSNGKTFSVIAYNLSKENIYIQSVKVNGKPYDKSYITHSMIMNGDTVELEMSNREENIWY